MIPLIGGIISAVGGIVGGIAGGAQRASAYQALTNATNIINKLQLPPDQAIPIILDQFKQAGVYTPELEQAVNNGVNALQNVQLNQPALQAQQQALQQLQQRGNVGLTAEDRVAVNQIRNQASADAQSRQAQILQNMQQMGQGGGGASLAAQLSNAQNASNMEANQSNQTAATAANRALQAIQASAGQANQLQGQATNLATQKAQAQNEMSRFNIQNQMAQNLNNANIANQAQQYNVQNQQNISNANTSQQNAEYLRQKQGQQQDFANQVGLAQLQSQAQNNLANMYLGQAANTGQMVSGVASGIGGGLAAYGQNQQNQQNFQTLADILNKNQLNNFGSNFQNQSTTEPASNAPSAYNNASEGFQG